MDMASAKPRLVVRGPDGTETVVELRDGSQVLGRAADADIRIQVDDVADHHAELTWDGSHLVLRDLKSGIGTTVNGRAVLDWVDLRDGDNIRIGLAEGRVESSSGASQPPPVQPATVPVPRGGASRRVFISHASDDKQSARALSTWLERRGWDVWLDETDIKGGSAWAGSIQSGIKESDVVILLVSSNSVAKEWVLDEVTSARNLRVPIIPAVLENVRYPEDLQFLLQRTQSVDITALEPSRLARLDTAIIDVLERQGKTNPDRVKLRIGQVLEVLGGITALAGFVWFIIAGFDLVTDGGFVGPDFRAVLIPFFVFMGGGIVAAIGATMVRSARSRGI
jgi:pSer/pThr/pTyr-binding forkhead associated (FHA) protein